LFDVHAREGASALVFLLPKSEQTSQQTTTMIDKLRFAFLRDALNGTGVFASGKGQGQAAALVKYPRESDEKYDARREISWYTNDLRTACNRFSGHLFGKPVRRDVTGDLYQTIADDCNWRGDSISVFMQSFVIQAKARGAMLLLVDMPKAIPVDQATQIQSRAVPYFVPIFPEDINTITVNERGLVTEASVLIDVVADGTAQKAVKRWKTDGWDIALKGSVIEQGAYDLGGLCPVIAFSEDNFPKPGEFAQIADLSRRLFNLRSELDEILRSQTFSLLTYGVPENASIDAATATTVAETISTSNMLMYSGTKQPGFIAPPDGPADVYLKAIEAIGMQIRHAAHDIEPPSGSIAAQSGVALMLRYQALNAALTHFAGRMEDFERRVWDMCSRWLGGNTTQPQVSWPKKFELADIALDITIAQQMQALGAPIGTMAALMKALIQNTVSGEPELIQRLLDEVDTSTKQVA
jgi:hypothetical protein